MTKIGSGTLTLGGANTYTGSTTISSGTLQIGNGGTTGTLGTGPVIDDAALRINRSNAITVANAISGSGTLTQAGSGTTTLSGGTGNTYTGLTTVSAGTLNLDKSSGNAIGGDLTISGGNVTYAAGRSHQIADTAAVTISSGNFNGTARCRCHDERHGDDRQPGGHRRLVPTGARVDVDGDRRRQFHRRHGRAFSPATAVTAAVLAV